MRSSFRPYLFTGFYSDHAFTVLYEIFRNQVELAREFDGEITFNDAFGMDRTTKRETLALRQSLRIKDYLKRYSALSDDPSKHRSDDSILPWCKHAKMREALFLIDWFKCLKKQTLIARYGEDLIKQFIGNPRDSFEIARAKLKDEEEQKIVKKWEDLKKKIWKKTRNPNLAKEKIADLMEDLRKIELLCSKEIYEFDKSFDKMMEKQR